MPDGPAPTEPLQTVTEPGGPTLLLTADEAKVYHDLTRFGERQVTSKQTDTVLRALVELGALRYRLENGAALTAEAPDHVDVRAGVEDLLKEAIATAENSISGPSRVRDLALALGALGGPTPRPVDVHNDPELLRTAARELVAVLARFSADDFTGRLEDLVAPLNALERALVLQA